MLTPAEVAARLRVHPRTIQRWAQTGVLRAVRLPTGRLRIEESEVDRMLGRPRSDGDQVRVSAADEVVKGSST